jgi:VPDSG-CTERM motif
MKKSVVFTVLATMTTYAAFTGTVQAGEIGQIFNCPDVGTTSGLLGIALAGLAIVKRFVR